MDEKGFISIEYLFTIFIVLIIASSLLFFTHATLESGNDVENNVHHRLILDRVANLVGQVNSHGGGYSAYLHLDSRPDDYIIKVEKNRLVMEFSNKKGETLTLPLKTDVNYKLYSGRDYLISRTNDGKIVIK